MSYKEDYNTALDEVFLDMSEEDAHIYATERAAEKQAARNDAAYERGMAEGWK